MEEETYSSNELKFLFKELHKLANKLWIDVVLNIIPKEEILPIFKLGNLSMFDKDMNEFSKIEWIPKKLRKLSLKYESFLRFHKLIFKLRSELKDPKSLNVNLHRNTLNEEKKKDPEGYKKYLLIKKAIKPK